MNKTDILNIFHARYACKNFDSARKISQEDFAYILEAGRLSPSSFGFEPWKLLVIQSPRLREKLAPMAWGAQNSLRGASHFVIILSRTASQVHHNSPYIQEMMAKVQGLPEQTQIAKKQRFAEFQEEFQILDSDRSLSDWASKQSYIPLANMMTAAALIGIDSCPIEGFVPDKVNQLLADEGIIDPAEFEVSVMVGFGYRAEEITPKTRRALEEIVQIVD